MRKMNLKSLFLKFFLLVASFFIILLLTFPKFLFLDRLLLKNGLYLTAESIEEGLLGLKLKDVHLYGHDSKLLRFDVLNIRFEPFKIKLIGVCENKRLSVDISFRQMSILSEDFNCIRKVDSLSANLSAKGGLYGSLRLKNPKGYNLPIEDLIIEFKGRTFIARAKIMGFELMGDGQIVYNSSNPIKSSINGQLKGMNRILIISGSLDSLEIKE